MTPPCLSLELRRPTLSLVAVALLCVLAAGTAAASTTITWNNPAGGVWSDAANWTPNQVPDAAGEVAVLPDLSGAYQVTLDVTPVIDQLTIGSGSTLVLDGNGFYAAGTLGLTIQSGGTVRGAGVIGMNVSNDGTIEADVSAIYPIRVDGIVSNRGVLRVINGATLTVNRPLISNWGTIESGDGGGRVSIDMPNNRSGMAFCYPGAKFVSGDGDLTLLFDGICNGEVQKSGTGTVRLLQSCLQDVTVAKGAELVIPANGYINLMASGTSLFNHGIVRVAGSIGFGIIDGPENIYLAGDGELILEGGTLGYGNGAPLVNSASHTISGCGTINPPFINKGTVDFDCGSRPAKMSGAIVNQGHLGIVHGRLSIGAGATVQNANGVLAADGGVIALGGTTAATLVGGRLDASAGGQVEVGKGMTATLRDVTVGPTGVLRTLVGTTVVSGARFVNQGTNDIGLGTFRLDPGTEYVQSGGVTQLGGGSLSATSDVRIDAGTMRGFGTVAANVVNGGEVDATAGILRVTGSYRQLGTGSLNVALTGSDANQTSRLVVGGGATLDGTLAASTAAGFTLAPGNSFDVVTYESVSGQFSRTVGLGPGTITPVYGKSELSLVVGAATGIDTPGRAPAALAFYGRRSTNSASFVLELPNAAELKARVYDASGREVVRLADGARPAGVHVFPLASANTLPSGLYFARIAVTTAAGSEVRTARVVFVR